MDTTILRYAVAEFDGVLWTLDVVFRSNDLIAARQFAEEHRGSYPFGLAIIDHWEDRVDYDFTVWIEL